MEIIKGGEKLDRVVEVATRAARFIFSLPGEYEDTRPRVAEEMLSSTEPTPVQPELPFGGMEDKTAAHYVEVARRARLEQGRES